MTDDSGSRRRGRGHRRRTVEVVGIDHVELAMPTGEEALARLFYGGVIGLQEVRRPQSLGRRTGLWFMGPGLALHLGVETPFRPSARAHPAFLVRNLDRARRRLAAHGVDVEDDPGALPIRRCMVSDPFGNLIELVDARDAGFTGTRPQRPQPDPEAVA